MADASSRSLCIKQGSVRDELAVLVDMMMPSDLSAPLICRERGVRGLFLILSRQKIFWYFMHMRGKTICEFTVKN